MTVIIAALVLVVFVTGFVLRAKGAPYSVGLLVAHKILAVFGAVILGYFMFRALQEGPLAGGTWASVMATVLFFGTAVATGGLLSTDKPQLPVISALHKLAPWFTILAAATTMYLLIT